MTESPSKEKKNVMNHMRSANEAERQKGDKKIRKFSLERRKLCRHLLKS